MRPQSDCSLAINPAKMADLTHVKRLWPIIVCMDRDIVDWMPREYRRRVSLVGSALDAVGRPIRFLVTNISYAGCQIIIGEDLVRGETLKMHLPNMGEIAGQVRWVSGGKCGIRFLIGISSKDDRRARIGV